MKYIVAGSRKVWRYEEVCTRLDLLRPLMRHPEIVSGMCPDSPDMHGYRWAHVMGFPRKEMPADWDKHDLCAGYIRNQEMAEYADRLIAFWDGKSNGTRDMIGRMRKLKKPYIVVLHGW